MNFGEEDSRFYIQGDGLKLEIPPEIGSLASRNNAPEEVIMGIRPEDLSVDEFGEVDAEIYMIGPRQGISGHAEYF